jgi:hypothetical protein
MLDKRKNSSDTTPDTSKESRVATNAIRKPALESELESNPQILGQIDSQQIEQAIVDCQHGRTVSREEALENLLEHA